MTEKGKELALLHLEHHLISRKILSIISTSAGICHSESIVQNKSRGMILRILGSEGPLNPSSLSYYLDLNKSSVTGLVNSLEKEGFVTRSPDPEDRRKCIISLSAEGKQYLKKIEGLIETISGQIIPYLDDSEYEEFLEGFRKIIDIEKRIETRLLDKREHAS
jgi:DNA-binding MarR family transcriptional regulator